MTTFSLSASVGTDGTNAVADVRALRRRLVDLGYDWLSEGDTVDADLTRTINLLQSIKSGRVRVSGDGRVDVPGATYDWLRAWNAPHWQEMPEGNEEDGFVNIEVTDPDDDHDFGTDWLADTIAEAGIWYRDNHHETHSGAAVITVNDASRPRGGDTPDHSGHETGLECDLRLPRADGTAPGGTVHTDDSVYDRDATRAMLQAFRVQPLVTEILFNDPTLIAEGLCRRAGGHDNHVHVGIAPLAPLVDYDQPVDELWRQALIFFGANPTLAPDDFPLTQEGFGAYTFRMGVRHFDASEMLTPHHPGVATSLGYSLFLPPHRWWPRGAALALLADRLRDLVDEPVVMRNWWRPRPYNAHPTVAGAADSDHITATGVDLDYRSADSRRSAESFLRTLTQDEEWLQVSIGLGNVTTHVGVLSPGREREWFYDSYPRSERP